MEIGIAGAGAIAMGYAALLLKAGHSVQVWSPSGGRTASLLSGIPLIVSGALEGVFRPNVCTIPSALTDCDVIVLALPAYGHRRVLDIIAPHIKPSNIVIISGHLSFAALYLAKVLSNRGLQIPIVAWNTTMLTAKARTPNEIKVGAVRSKVDMATLPARLGEQAHKVCVSLFGDRFVMRDDLLTIALSNLNPQNHLGTALCNLTRIERGEVWGQRANVTPAVGRLLEAMDEERLLVAASFGKAVRTILDHYALSFNVGRTSVVEISQELARRGSDPLGPTTLETRYVLEDVPYGLVPTLYLARLAGVAIPLHQSGVDILSACYGRNFSAENDLLGELDLLNVAVLMDLVSNGYPVAR
ncbi:hypothetical protein GCM10007913_44400 [Devosia yakushimensis]|uniref:2-dehydropantoate 2-reductase n=1 Tax=Devosia yakushimensis TaxID=470028 RepID=A0ABQ5UMB4_9HYPH|nr:NAD/NADP-dependent octopine/nopaline dehydrogenase family protein [Devosia yakushimensis]GLQ12507.1 hypothetical protein GCM10007913_44400 [Devosia yakushimensis]